MVNFPEMWYPPIEMPCRARQMIWCGYEDSLCFVHTTEMMCYLYKAVEFESINIIDFEDTLKKTRELSTMFSYSKYIYLLSK